MPAQQIRQFGDCQLQARTLNHTHARGYEPLSSTQVRAYLLIQAHLR